MSSNPNRGKLWLCYTTKIFEVELSPVSSDQQPVKIQCYGPFMCASNRVSNNIGYCHIIDGSPAVYNTVYAFMNTVRDMMTSHEWKDSVFAFDLAIYMKAKDTQCDYEMSFMLVSGWLFYCYIPSCFSISLGPTSVIYIADIVIWMEGFHISIAYRSLLGNKYSGSGIEDLLIESDVYGSGIAATHSKGKSYNRGIFSAIPM